MHLNPHRPTKDHTIRDGEPRVHDCHGSGHPGAGRSPARPGNNRLLTTDEFAAELGMSAQSIRKRYSQTGSYFDLRPIKLPNRRLLWPADALEQLINR
ncbi:AlpA family transcriptional regulator [Paraburkholderia terrae]|uniref:helix-turn-helix transcriptional regulator n=1 Tax=Paraburkholderia terrae TaxID=311230 RepID=UPI001EE20360|nr:helix-turn-helix domain-containing protein [Paraburkholderia terrae]GJG99148.1 hypothetical protein CBA19C8_01350 [Paraburkholderia terrae]